jgi:hypothetical protein
LPRCQTIAIISKSIAFLVAALMLANCCASGSGCAPAAGTPVAWDGLGPAPTEEAQSPEARPKPQARAKREIAVGPLDVAATGQNSRFQPRDEWERQQAADQADDAKLKRKLMICRTCLSGETARDDAAGDSR